MDSTPLPLHHIPYQRKTKDSWSECKGKENLVAYRGNKSKPRFVQDWGDLSISLDNVDETPRREEMRDSWWDVMGEEKWSP